jgi:hypothetical protein
MDWRASIVIVHLYSLWVCLKYQFGKIQGCESTGSMEHLSSIFIFISGLCGYAWNSILMTSLDAPYHRAIWIGNNLFAVLLHQSLCMLEKAY